MGGVGGVGGNRPNRGDVNIGSNNNINVDNGWGDWDDHIHHPIAAGMVVGGAVALTAAAMGSWYYSLPGGCSPYPYSGYSYYSCGGAYYAPQYEGDTIVYVTVPDPKTGQAPPSGIQATKPTGAPSASPAPAPPP